MKKTLEAKEQELKRIFSDDYLFEIPAYQRPYAWQIEQVTELLDDLMVAMGDDGEMEEKSPYFLGSIVLIKDPSRALSQVVDGQQRLTTLTIIFCVLRELSTAKKARDNLNKYICEEGSIFEESEDRFRLSLRERDRNFFRKNIQEADNLSTFLEQDKAPFTDSQQRIYENSDYIFKQLASLGQTERDHLTKFLVQRCYLVVVSASDQNSAYRVFSVMNDRGLNLSPTDILKADIIGEMPENIRTTYTDQWEEIEEELGREDFRELFAHIRMIHVKSKARGNLHQEFQDGVLSTVKGREFIDNVLIPLSEAYQIVSKSAYESTGDAERVNAHLRYLNRLDNYDWIPPAIAYFEKQQDDRDALFHFFRDLERLAYALFITRANINDRVNRYANVLRAIEKGDNLYSYTSALQLSDGEKSAVVTVLNGPIYLQTRVRMPLLLRLDSLLADEGATYEHKVLSVEHVLPQTPATDSIWLERFPDPEVRELWTHRLANLVLLSRRKNTQAQNFDFERKKREYFQKQGVATFAITTQVLNQSEWTPDVLEMRQSELIGKLESEWCLA